MRVVQQLTESNELSESRQQELEALRLLHQQSLAAHQAERERHKVELTNKEEETQQKERALQLLMKLNLQSLTVRPNSRPAAVDTSCDRILRAELVLRSSV